MHLTCRLYKSISKYGCDKYMEPYPCAGYELDLHACLFVEWVLSKILLPGCSSQALGIEVGVVLSTIAHNVSVSAHSTSNMQSD